jgi:hypothetical protein
MGKTITVSNTCSTVKRIEPVTEDSLAEEDGRLVIPASGEQVITDDDLRALRDAGRR